MEQPVIGRKGNIILFCNQGTIAFPQRRYKMIIMILEINKYINIAYPFLKILEKYYKNKSGKMNKNRKKKIYKEKKTNDEKYLQNKRPPPIDDD